MIIPGFHIHINGGGLIEDTASVESSVYVGPDAIVCDRAWVSGNARVYESAQVSGSAWVKDDARVSGEARVGDKARIADNAQIYGDAQVFGNAWIFGNIFIKEGIIETRELWGLYSSLEDGWVDRKNKRFDNVVGYSWYDIENSVRIENNLFAIPLINCVPDFNKGVRL